MKIKVESKVTVLSDTLKEFFGDKMNFSTYKVLWLIYQCVMVIHEDKLKIEGAMKAPDYSFRLVGGNTCFLLKRDELIYFD